MTYSKGSREEQEYKQSILTEAIGTENLLDSVMCWLSSDMAIDILNDIARDYDIDFEDEEEEE